MNGTEDFFRARERIVDLELVFHLVEKRMIEVEFARVVPGFFRKLRAFLLKQGCFLEKVRSFLGLPQRRFALGGNWVCKALNFPSVMRSNVSGTYILV